MTRAALGIGLLIATLLFSSCGNPSTTVIPTKQMPQTEQVGPSPEISETNAGQEVLLEGVVTEVQQEPRPQDAGGWFTLITDEDTQVLVVFEFWEGEFPPCVNEEAKQTGSELSVGDSVEVFGRILAGDQITTCDSSQYYIHLK